MSPALHTGCTLGLKNLPAFPHSFCHSLFCKLQ